MPYITMQLHSQTKELESSLRDSRRDLEKASMFVWGQVFVCLFCFVSFCLGVCYSQYLKSTFSFSPCFYAVSERLYGASESKWLTGSRKNGTEAGTLMCFCTFTRVYHALQWEIRIDTLELPKQFSQIMVMYKAFLAHVGLIILLDREYVFVNFAAITVC